MEYNKLIFFNDSPLSDNVRLPHHGLHGHNFKTNCIIFIYI